MDDYIRHLRELQNWLNRKEIGIRLWPGCEILYTDQAASMVRAREIPTLGGGDWALVEFLPETPWSTIEKAVREFGNYGIGMVAAHVERYQCLREDLSLLEELSESGVLCQMNAETVARSATVLGDRWAKRALRHGLIDLVASDMHRTDWRPPNLDKAWETIRKQYGGGTASLLMEKNPGSLLPGTWY